MQHSRAGFVLLGVALFALCSWLPTSVSAQGGAPSLPAVAHVCGPAAPGAARCHAIVRTDVHGLQANGSPSGYLPANLQLAYNLLSSTATPTVAIVDAYDDPYAYDDLVIYRAQFGLPACTTTTGCFRKVNQTGGAAYPSANTSWAEEISLDLDMVSAICPNCKILLVEASSATFADLGLAVNYAASQPGVAAISNSYGGGEFSGETSYDKYYNHAGIAVTVSSGDSGYGVEYPAASPYVTAVGGTTLCPAPTTGSTDCPTNMSSPSRRYTETVWSGAGSGCSAVETKRIWQTDTGCSRRTVADVSADADPYTGVAVYDSYGETGWLVFGGTSVASPIIASVYALAGNAGSITYGSFSYAAPTTSLFDVTSGSNGHCTRGAKSAGSAYLCTGGAGYDGPTGNGTPNGSGGF